MIARLEVTLENEACVPGDTVRGTVFVVEDEKSRSLTASLEYHEKTEEYSHMATCIPGGHLHEGDLTAGMSFDFTLQLPADALPNFRSQHGELYWEVHARSDEPGFDTHARRRLSVSLPLR
ncbi:MAG: hypothetical protein ACR2KK_04030 [Acidimicrobiales bacterium]